MPTGTIAYCGTNSKKGFILPQSGCPLGSAGCNIVHVSDDRTVFVARPCGGSMLRDVQSWPRYSGLTRCKWTPAIELWISEHSKTLCLFRRCQEQRDGKATHNDSGCNQAARSAGAITGRFQCTCHNRCMPCFVHCTQCMCTWSHH